MFYKLAYRRLFARLFDVYLYGLLSSILVNTIVYCSVMHLHHFFFEVCSYIDQTTEEHQKIYRKIFFSILNAVLGLLVFEPIIFLLIRNTVGKALLKVSFAANSHITLRDYYLRCAKVLTYALGFGIPIVCLGTAFRQFFIIESTGKASYDTVKLSCSDLGKLHFLLYAGLFSALIYFIYFHPIKIL